MPEITYRESSRIKITDAPIQIPGVCIICGASRSDDNFSGSSASNISDDGSQKFARDATEYFRLIESSEQDASKSGNSTKQSSSKQRSDDVSSSREFNI